MNTSDAWSRGIEVEAEWNGLKWLAIEGNYVFQQSKDENATDIRKEMGDPTPEITLDYLPRHGAGISLSFDKKIKNMKFEARLSEVYVGKRSYREWTFVNINDPDQVLITAGSEGLRVYVSPPQITLEPYWRTDVSIDARFKDNFWINLTVQNLFNARYEESGGTYAPGTFPSIEFGIEL
jgi:outer membrane receptor protein involved in Fe transport